MNDDELANIQRSLTCRNCSTLKAGIFPHSVPNLRRNMRIAPHSGNWPMRTTRTSGHAAILTGHCGHSASPLRRVRAQRWMHYQGSPIPLAPRGQGQEI